MGSSTVNIKVGSEEWTEDTIDKNYVSKVYSINSSIKHTDYEVSITGDVPEGTKIVTADGKETTKFSGDSKFKIMLPIEKLESDGSFTINIKTEVKTKPVIYGASPNSSWQNYALTAYMYEDATSSLTDTYKKIEKPEIPVTPKKEQPTEEVKILPVTGM